MRGTPGRLLPSTAIRSSQHTNKMGPFPKLAALDVAFLHGSAPGLKGPSAWSSKMVSHRYSRCWNSRSEIAHCKFAPVRWIQASTARLPMHWTELLNKRGAMTCSKNNRWKRKILTAFRDRIKHTVTYCAGKNWAFNLLPATLSAPCCGDLEIKATWALRTLIAQLVHDSTQFIFSLSLAPRFLALRCWTCRSSLGLSSFSTSPELSGTSCSLFFQSFRSFDFGLWVLQIWSNLLSWAARGWHLGIFLGILCPLNLLCCLSLLGQCLCLSPLTLCSPGSVFGFFSSSSLSLLCHSAKNRMATMAAMAWIRPLWRDLLPSSFGQRNATTVTTHSTSILDVSLGCLCLGLWVWLCCLHATFRLAAFTWWGFWLWWRQLIKSFLGLLSWFLSAGPWPCGHTAVAARNIGLRAFGTKELFSAWVQQHFGTFCIVLQPSPQWSGHCRCKNGILCSCLAKEAQGTVLTLFSIKHVCMGEPCITPQVPDWVSMREKQKSLNWSSARECKPL